MATGSTWLGVCARPALDATTTTRRMENARSFDSPRRWLRPRARSLRVKKRRRRHMFRNPVIFHTFNYCHPGRGCSFTLVNEHRSRGTLRFVPLGCQILPAGVLAFDQPHFLFAAPALELFLAIDRICNVIEAFPIYEASAIVVVGEALADVILMLPDALPQGVRHF